MASEPNERTAMGNPIIHDTCWAVADLIDGYTAPEKEWQDTLDEVSRSREEIAGHADALLAAHEAGIEARDKDLRSLAAEATAAEGRCREQRNNGLGYQSEYLLGKADVFAWTARRLRSLVDGE